MAFRIKLALCLLLWTGSDAQKQEGTGSPCYKTDDYGNQDLEQPQVETIFRYFWKIKDERNSFAIFHFPSRKKMPSSPIDMSKKNSAQVAARCEMRALKNG